MKARTRSLEDEFEFGKGRKSNLDNFSLSRYWQKGYGSERFTNQYIKDCYSSDPQAVFKVISYGKGKGSAKAMLEYVNNREGVAQEFYTQDGEALKGDDDIKELYGEWSSEFRKKGSGRGEQRHLTHMLLSADVEQTKNNANKVLAAAQETLWDEFGVNGYEYTFVLHKDTENPHVHCILKNYNSKTKRKLRLDRHDFLRIRSSFAKDMTDRGLKRHVATLRRDRPETLHKTQTTIKSLTGNVENMNKQLDNCAFSNRKTQLNAQLSKTIKQFDYNDTKIEFDYSQGFLQLRSNKIGKPFENTLQKIAIEELSSKKFGVASNNHLSIVNLRDIQKLTKKQEKDIKLKFDKLIKQKVLQQKTNMHNKIIQRSKDILPQYQATLVRTNYAIKMIRKSNLSIFQKREQLKELKIIRHKLLNNYDLKEIQKSSLLKANQEYLKIFKELDKIKTKVPTAKEFIKRKQSLEQWRDQHIAMLKMRERYFKNIGDGDTARLLRGLQSEKDFNALAKQQAKIQKNILSPKSQDSSR